MLRVYKSMVWAMLVLAGLSWPHTAMAGEEGKMVPRGVTLAGLDGGKLKTSNLTGEVRVIEFFASWCEGCSEVMLRLHRIAPKDSQFQVVSVDENIGQARGYFKRKPEVRKLRRVAYFDRDAQLAESLAVESLPAVVVIGKDGKVLLKIEGHPTSQQYKDIRRLLRR